MIAKIITTAGAVAAVAAVVAARLAAPPVGPAAIRAGLVNKADSLDATLVALSAALRTATPGSTDSPTVRAAFAQARVQFKHVEGVVEFYAPALAAAFNSRRQEVDDDDAPPPATLAASGFPALERLLWPALAAVNVDSAVRIADGMRPLARRLRTMVPALVPTEAQLIELSRQELARVSTVGIAGFDAPLTREAISESADALDGIENVLRLSGEAFWKHHAHELQAVDTDLARAAGYLRGQPGFESFNRLAFIAVYAEPAARSLDALRRATVTRPIGIPRAWRFDVASVYDRGAFDPRVYAPSTAPASTRDLVALGARLFFDRSLSGPRTRSCASCHNPALAFADGVQRARSIDSRGSVVARNTPTLINAALQPAQFADERSVTLEDQALEVLRSPAEMSSSAELAASRLGADASYRAGFGSAFDHASRDSVTPLRVRQALAAYVRSLIALDSPFDRAVRGDTMAMSGDERRGFSLFMGKAGCGTCHFAPLFGGNTPPRYLASDVETIGTTSSPAANAPLDSDSGRARIDGLPTHLRAFKTPSLRNVALTGPYMHNGAFRTLDDVLLFYAHGGGAGGGAHLSNQTLSADSLHLSASERHAIVAFLSALTDTTIRAPK